MHTSSSACCTRCCSGAGGLQAPSSSSEASPHMLPHESLLAAFSFLYTITIAVSNISNLSPYPSTRSSVPPPLSLSLQSLTSSFPAPFPLASSAPSSPSSSVLALQPMATTSSPSGASSPSLTLLCTILAALKTIIPTFSRWAIPSSHPPQLFHLGSHPPWRAQPPYRLYPFARWLFNCLQSKTVINDNKRHSGPLWLG